MKPDRPNEPWPYETRPIADQGASEAKYDGQGALVSGPDKGKPLSDYEQLLQGLYNAARVSSRTANDTYLAFVGVYAGFLDHTHPNAAHQIREGIRDAQKPSQNPCANDGADGIKRPDFEFTEEDLKPLARNLKKFFDYLAETEGND